MTMTKMNQKIRTYSELVELKTFKERYEYLKLGGKVGEETFGFDRYLNQMFYKSKEWQAIRRDIIIRDNGCDLGIPGYEIIEANIVIHHMNPITKKDILYKTDFLLNPEYLISTIKRTHDGIHYGTDEEMLNYEPIVRSKNDTCPWRH